jgi:hypothetical protein
MKIIMILALFTVITLFNIARGGEDQHGHHEHTAPHGGTLVVFGDEFAHLELVLDPEEGKLTAYVLDGEAENPVRIKQEYIELKISIKGPDNRKGGPNFPLKLKAVANPLTGETEGDTSQFTGQSEHLKDVTNFEAVVIEVVVKGKEFKNVVFNYPQGNE